MQENSCCSSTGWVRQHTSSETIACKATRVQPRRDPFSRSLAQTAVSGEESCLKYFENRGAYQWHTAARQAQSSSSTGDVRFQQLAEPHRSSTHPHFLGSGLGNVLRAPSICCQYGPLPFTWPTTLYMSHCTLYVNQRR